MAEPLALRCASEQAAGLAKGHFSARELLSEIVSRIDRINPALNAIVTLDRERAEAQAVEADKRIAAGTTRPLEGLPITIKDAFDVAGMRSTAGSPAFSERIPEKNASAVARLRNAGAIIIGKTNVPVFSGDFQAFNPVFGTTNNPFDLARSPGGSSGGAAAAVSTGMSAFELGSDLGGSIRWPAHACGIFGLKPTWSLTSSFGHVPPLPDRRITRETDLTVAGPLTRSATDLALLLPILAGSRDFNEPAPLLAPPRTRDVKRLRVALWIDEGFAPVDDQVRGAVLQAAALLRDAGAQIDETARPDFSFEESFECYALLNHAIVAAGLPEAVRDKIAAQAVNFAERDLSHRALQARGARLTPETYQSILSRRRAIKAKWDAFFERFDIVLCPPAPVTAILHDHGTSFHNRTIIVNGGPRPYFDFLMWSSLATIAHLPAATVPVRLDASGLPSGVQLIGPEFEDMTVIQAAIMLENLGCKALVPKL